MRFLLVLAGLALALGNPLGTQESKFKIADKDFLLKQKRVLELFKYVNQPSYLEEHVKIAKDFKLLSNLDYFSKPEVVKQFLEYWKYDDMLPRGEIFSVFYENHLQQAKLLFKLFYFAKDFETFYKTAVWARQNLNEGLFLYTLSVALVYRADTQGIILPPIYEVYPYYFFNNEVITKAQYYKQVYQGDHLNDKTYTILANYSGFYLNLHPEQSINYYLEDIGLNSFYYYYNIFYPFWLGGEEFGFEFERRGELFYYVHQQLLARYYLERLSNGFGEIKTFNWDLPFDTPYYSSLRYPNGLQFPERPKFAKLEEYFYNYGQKWTWTSKYGYSYSFVKDYERRIRDALDRGFIYTNEGKRIDFFTEEGFNTLGNLIESNPNSPDNKYFGSIQVFARHLLGYSYQPLDDFKVAPSALEHFETSLRDPAFYQLYKKITLYFQRYFSKLTPYTKKELVFPGVKILKVTFDRLITFFDTFDTDLRQAVYVTPEEYQKEPFQVKARQYRLNHKPFSYSIKVQSSEATKATVKVFLGPKYDEYGRLISLKENRVNFVEIDHFVEDLQAGENTITRNSYDAYFYGKDKTSFYDLYKQVLGASEGTTEFRLDGSESFFRFPQRLLLPKGTENGLSYQFYIIVYPYKEGTKADLEYFYPRAGKGYFVDNYPLGFPFDRFIEHEKLWYQVPNSYFYEAKIFNKRVEDLNVSNKQL